MKGERQMIYKNITFKADPFLYDLKFDDRITLVGGDSGVGKTVLYEMLEDIRLTDCKTCSLHCSWHRYERKKGRSWYVCWRKRKRQVLALHHEWTEESRS